MNLTLYTATCQACNKRISKTQDVFCIECYGDLPISHFDYSADNALKDKFKGLLPINCAGAWLYYNQNELVQYFLKEIKYNQNTHLATELGRLSVNKSIDAIRNSIDIIIPIPLHKHKLQLRGYNQTEFLGQGMSEILNIPLNNQSLVRGKNTSSQTKYNREKRFENVDNAFDIKYADKITNKRVLLIDDVITTGATIEGAGRKLLEAGVQSLSVFSLATAFDL